MVCMFQGIYKEPIAPHLKAIYSIVIPGSEIPSWFSHQSMGTTVNARVTHLNKNVNIQVPSCLCNKWIGLAGCAVFSGPNLRPNNHDSSGCLFLIWDILVNNRKGAWLAELFSNTFVQIKSDHLWLFYLPPRIFNENERAVLSQIDENDFIQMEIRFTSPLNQCLEVKKCGFRLVYEQDIEDIREMMAQSSNSTCITPYEGLDVRHDLDNSTEYIKIKRSHDEYDGAGPSGEGSSNDVPHSKRIQR